MTDQPTRLRFGLMLRSKGLNAWQAEVLEQLVAVDGVDLELLIIDGRSRPDANPLARLNRMLRSSSRLWNLYNNGWVARRSAALQPVSLPAVLASTQTMTVTVDQLRSSEHFRQDDVRAIEAYDLDVILRFGFGILRGEVLHAARHGIWSFHHGDETVARGGPPAFWEIVRGDATTGAMLQRLTERLDAGEVLARGWFPTAHHSYVRNTDRVHFGSAHWPALMARRLLDQGALEHAAMSPSTASITKQPTDRVTGPFLVRQLARFARHQWHALTRSDDWHIGVVDGPPDQWLDPSGAPEICWLESTTTARAYAADPFVIDRGDGPTVLYERYDRQRRLGEIWEVALDQRMPPRSSALPIDVHASYPSVLEHDGQRYCLPQVALPGAPLFVEAGGRWKHVCDLIPGLQVLDPTVVRHDGRWWLFGTLPGRESTTQLHVWFADDLTGPWTPHRHNPVKTDARSARPAGPLFESAGRLIRPAQDCSNGYGRGVSLCEVRRLDPEVFDEIVLRVVEPDASWPHSEAMHTLTGWNGLTVIDAASIRFDRFRLGSELTARWHRIRPSLRTAQTDSSVSKVDTEPVTHVAVPAIRVLAVIDALGEGGSERSLAELLPLLRDRSIETTIVLLRSRGDEGVEQSVRSLGFDVHVLPVGFARRLHALRRLIHTLEPAVIHSSLFEANIAARLAALGKGIPLLTSLVSTTYSPEHLDAQMIPRWKSRLVQTIDLASTRLGRQHFHAVSEPVRAIARRSLRLSAEQIVVAHRGRNPPQVDRESARAAVRSELGLAPQVPIVISLGRQEPAKDLPTLIAGAARALRRHPTAVLLLAGRQGSSTAAVDEAVAALESDVRGRVRMLGHRSDVTRLLAAADVYVSTSLYEGLPGAIIEAMATSLAVVASDIAATAEVVDADTTAILCPAGDFVAFGAAIDGLLSDPERRHALGQAGREVFIDRFTAERAAESMEALYRAVAADRS